MAFLDVTRDQPARAPAPQSAEPQSADTNRKGRLTGLERDVLLLSRSDSIATIRQQGPWRLWLAGLLSIRGGNRLADPHLEALRRFAVLHRHAARLNETAEVDRLSALGYSSAAITQARDILGREAHTKRRNIHRRIAATTALAAPVGWLFVTAAKALDNYLLAGVLTALFSLPLATLTRSR